MLTPASKGHAQLPTRWCFQSAFMATATSKFYPFGIGAEVFTETSVCGRLLTLIDEVMLRMG